MSASRANRSPTVYRPAQQTTPRLGPYLVALGQNRHLIWHLAWSGLRSQRYGTILGQGWLVLEPLLLALIYYLVRMVFRVVGDGTQDVLAHLIWAVFVFYFVRRTIWRGASSITGNRTLILTTTFPRAVLPAAGALSSLLAFLPAIGLYLVLHPALGQPVGVSLIYLPVIVGLIAIFATGVAFLFATANVLARDTGEFLTYGTRLWLYVTPILYDVSEIPEHLRPYLRLNPLYPSYGALDQIFHGLSPSVTYMVAALAWALGAIALGGWVFLTRERDFAIRL